MKVRWENVTDEKDFLFCFVLGGFQPSTFLKRRALEMRLMP